jgi:hypothetical protein
LCNDIAIFLQRNLSGMGINVFLNYYQGSQRRQNFHLPTISLFPSLSLWYAMQVAFCKSFFEIKISYLEQPTKKEARLGNIFLCYKL